MGVRQMIAATRAKNMPIEAIGTEKCMIGGVPSVSGNMWPGMTAKNAESRNAERKSGKKNARNNVAKKGPLNAA